MTLAKSSLFFAIGTLLSRITGLLRESIKAAIFGAGVLNDAFIVAYRIPNLFREMLAEGALGASFTSRYTAIHESDPQRARALLRDMLIVTGLGVGLLSIVGMLASPYLVKLLTLYAGKSEGGPELIRQATGLTRILFPFITLMSLGAVVAGALHQKGRFFLSSAASIALNVGFILGAALLSGWFYDHGPEWIEEILADRRVVGLAVGVLIGGGLQFAVLASGIWGELKACFGTKNAGKGRGGFFSEDVRSVLKLMGPMAIAGSASQVNIMVNTNFATTLQAGSVTWLSSAFFLVHLPVAIFGVAIGSAALPSLSRAIAAAGQVIDERVSRELQNTIELVLWLLIPSFVAIQVAGEPAVRLVFQHGRFTPSDALATANTLAAYSYGLVGYAMVKVLISYYYAMGRTGYAMRVSLGSIALNFAANYFLVSRFQHRGLAFTAAAVTTINASLLFAGIFKDSPLFNGREGLKALGYLLAGAGLSMLGCRMILPGTTFIAELPDMVRDGVLLVIAGSIIAACFGAMGCLRLRKTPLQLVRMLKR